MPYNGSGVFTPDAADFPAVPDTIIESAKYNNVINDIAAGLSNAITADGQTTPTDDISLGNNKITNLANGVADTDAATIADIQSAKDQWKATGLTPTYVSTTVFTLAGNQTAEFTVNRRVKATVSGGTRYGYIASSVFSTLTTVTLVLDSSTLNVGLSAVALGLLTPTNSAIPKNFKPHFNTADFGIAFDSTTDDTAAWQLAIDTVTAARGTLEIVAPVAGNYSKITAALTFTGPIEITGPGPNAATIMAVGVSAGSYIFDFNLVAADNIEWILLSGFTLRSNNNGPWGMRLKNASYVHVRDVRFYDVEDGIIVDGTRCFTHIYDNVVGYTITGATVQFASTFIGGGQFIYNGCTFTGDIGFEAISGAFIDNISFNGCNFEQCVSHSVGFFGTTAGLNFTGCRTEGCDGVDFNLRPFGVAEYINGLAITGCVFGSSDAGSIGRIYLGGDSGKVRGFSITGNSVTHGTDSFAGAFVTTNGDGESGVIAGNMLRGTTCTILSAQRAGVVVYANENLAGKLPEYWGTSNWIVSGPTVFALTDASGTGLALPVAGGHYVRIGPCVYWQAVVVYPATGDTAAAKLAGLPVAVLNGSAGQGRAGGTIYSDSSISLAIQPGVSSTTSFNIVNAGTLAAITNAQLSAKTLYISGFYAT